MLVHLLLQTRTFLAGTQQSQGGVVTRCRGVRVIKILRVGCGGPLQALQRLLCPLQYIVKHLQPLGIGGRSSRQLVHGGLPMERLRSRGGVRCRRQLWMHRCGRLCRPLISGCSSLTPQVSLRQCASSILNTGISARQPCIVYPHGRGRNQKQKERERQ